MAAHEQGGGRSYDRFYSISIAIIGERGRGCPADRGEAVFVVISEGVCAARDGSRGQGAVGQPEHSRSPLPGQRVVRLAATLCSFLSPGNGEDAINSFFYSLYYRYLGHEK